jgi:YihY family inner membrane protein
MRQKVQQPSAQEDGMASSAKHQVKKATSFWTKINEDWMLSFSGMLAYNYLTAIAPILLAVLAIAGFVLGSLSPEAYHSFVNGLASRFPAGAGQSFVTGALAALQRNAGALLIIAIIAAIFSGSRLFVALDNIFAVIYRVDVRSFLKQNIMALLMMLLFLLLAPLAFFASSVPGAVLSNVLPSGAQSNGVVLTFEGFVGGVVVAFILFAVIYYVVPNTRQRWETTWPGALATAVLLNLYELLFPIYQRLFLKDAGFGSAAGLVIVILIFLYYIGVITLLGAEINAWASGLRPLGVTLPQLFRNQRQTGDGSATEAQVEQPEQPEQAESPLKSLTNRLAALRHTAPRPPSDDHALPST